MTYCTNCCINDLVKLNCASLKEITLPSSVTVIDNETFRGCTGLERVMLPKSLTEISYYAFSGCTSLTEVVIPETVDTICWGAFSDCTALKKVYFDGDVPAIWGRKASPYNWWGYTYAVVLPEDTEAEYRTTVTGCKAEYSITDVEPGIYILQVNKKNHIIRTYRIAVE